MVTEWNNLPSYVVESTSLNMLLPRLMVWHNYGTYAEIFELVELLDEANFSLTVVQRYNSAEQKMCI